MDVYISGGRHQRLAEHPGLERAHAGSRRCPKDIGSRPNIRPFTIGSSPVVIQETRSEVESLDVSVLLELYVSICGRPIISCLLKRDKCSLICRYPKRASIDSIQDPFCARTKILCPYTLVPH